MATRSLRAFERRVGLFVTLVVAFVLVLSGLHAVLQAQAHQRLSGQTRQRALLVAELVLAESGASRLARAFRDWQAQGTRPRLPGLSARWERQLPGSV